MSNPSAPAARRGTAEMMETNPFRIPADSEAIYAPRFEAGWNAQKPETRFLVCEAMDGFEAFNIFACNFGAPFLAEMECIRFGEREDRFLECIAGKVDEGYGLLMLGPRAFSCRQHLFAAPLYKKIAKKLSLSLLVVPTIRWPISRILVLVQGEQKDEAAVDWGVRLARANNGDVTLLPILPPVPVLYQGLGRTGSGLPELLSTETMLGQNLRRAAARLVAEDLGGTLRLHHGLQEMQIRIELLEQDHDLIVVGTEDPHWFRKATFGPNLCHLVQWADRPVLLAK